MNSRRVSFVAFPVLFFLVPALTSGNASFTMDHLDPGQYRVCAWLEEGAEVNSMLGNPRYEEKLAAVCEIVPVSADEHKNIHLKQVSAADLK